MSPGSCRHSMLRLPQGTLPGLIGAIWLQWRKGSGCSNSGSGKAQMLDSESLAAGFGKPGRQGARRPQARLLTVLTGRFLTGYEEVPRTGGCITDTQYMFLLFFLGLLLRKQCHVSSVYSLKQRPCFQEHCAELSALLHRLDRFASIRPSRSGWVGMAWGFEGR